MSATSGERFPHVYGRLNWDAVVRVLPLVEGAEGVAIPD